MNHKAYPGALVFDLGSQSFRIGYAGDEYPRVDIPSWVGVSHDGAPTAGPLERGDGEGNRINKGGGSTSQYSVDVTRLRVPRPGTVYDLPLTEPSTEKCSYLR